ncbi:MAG: hypothetical protein S4CHLAM102_00720 [Chlamydiia bacterium]|nr:hypothetical protein [Chlamydiia bacterium]
MFLFIWSRLSAAYETLWVIFHTPQFVRCNWAHYSAYFFKSPYQVAKSDAIQRGEREIYQYGVTPIFTFASLFKEFSPPRAFLDLGCGSGKLVCFADRVWGWDATGVDHNALFIQKAKKMAARPHFICADFLEVDYSRYDLIYLNGLCLSDREILLLGERLEPGVIVTVGFAFSEYFPDGKFKLQKKVSRWYPWGKSDVYIEEILRS